eukprot:5863819-Pleurochrysis_carterae.AAC.1
MSKASLSPKIVIDCSHGESTFLSFFSFYRLFHLVASREIALSPQAISARRDAHAVSHGFGCAWKTPCAFL